MPSRNLEKVYLPGYFYHVFNRGVNKQAIFLDDEDYRVFLNLLKRYLDVEVANDNKGRDYEWLHERLELLAYCLMPNHFHILIYQHDELAMTRLLRGVSTSYSGYFNKKYRRVGPVFQDRYKASLISQDAYLQHISRYIHLNPRDYLSWEYSSLPYYLKQKEAGWIKPGRIIDLFEGADYLEFVKDYEESKKMLDEIKRELAN